MSPAVNRRILIYSHDTYGLGHFRRSTLIARSLLASGRFGHVLIATGSPRAQSFELPEGCDVVALPAVTKTAEGSYCSRDLRLPLDELLALRRRLLTTAVEAFRPEILLVDHAPLGVERELQPVLDELLLAESRPRLVLGLREIIDDAGAVDREWTRNGAWRYVEEVYDQVLVYGDPAVRTTAQELELPRRLGSRLKFTGYLVRRSDEDGPRAVPPHILVTAGGGGDGQRLLRAYAAFLEALPGPAPFRSEVVLGPLLSERRRQDLMRRFAGVDQDVSCRVFERGLEHAAARARGIVAMGGYNTVMEILGAGVPALIHPRTEPRREQLIRAERLAAHAPIECCVSSRALPGHIARFIDRVLHAPPGHHDCRLDLDGTQRLPGLLDEADAPGLATCTDERAHRGE